MSGQLDRKLIQSVSVSIQGHAPLTFVAKGIAYNPDLIEEGDLFVPLKGEMFDGHQLIEAAVENGAIGALWRKDEPVPGTLSDDFPLFIVKDPEQAVAEMAERYLFDIDPSRVAVTGDYTRHLTRIFLKNMLKTNYRVYLPEETLGDPFTYFSSILSMPDDTDIILFDVPARTDDIVKQASELIIPQLAVLCCHRDQHEEDILEHAGYIEEGMRPTGTIFVDGDRWMSRDWKTDSVIYGNDPEHLLQIESVAEANEEVQFTIKGVRFLDFHLPWLMKDHLQSVLAAFGPAVHLGMGAEVVAQAISELEMKDFDLEECHSKDGTVVLIDHGRSLKSGLKYSLGMLKHLHHFQRRVLVVDEGFQQNPLKEKLIHEVFADELRSPVTDIITIGEKAFWIRSALKHAGIHLEGGHYDTHHQAMDELTSLLKGDTLLLYRGLNSELLKQMIKEWNE
ncbi:UDP-N-acetylmuramoyl-tripeptide--D-alanyl-D-alanine ligase [Salisediminibacterium beveridgei]|uniref:UDP-N-acetylmuramoylalanyl-D-glutamyl-2, 6-diaminopimelate--D-alanyl-D-alanyl ligase n=1 Tax=Salisediminibacterium beveridgei TaxID=632773 RepID=A0A1D7QW86_9BACI|nr:hypothetical protein [Salisediminibacterium beveridgei]AOM83277.1 UDP-N-acetylmuramoylalanyl-D-glutamyl-2,6-diaminopimelate--D-alanyl-D- alanyl ligase [Salisediminibacterium beveridgei]